MTAAGLKKSRWLILIESEMRHKNLPSVTLKFCSKLTNQGIQQL